MFSKLVDKSASYNTGLISRKTLEQSLQSYFGMLKHCRGYRVRKELQKLTRDMDPRS